MTAGDLNLPFEPGPTGQTIDLADALVCGGLIVMAVAVPVPGLGTLPGLVFRFAQATGTFLPPVVLAAPGQELRDLVRLVEKASAAAIQAAAPMRSWTFDLPISKPLSLNDRQHWAPRHREVRLVRDAAHQLARHLKIPPLKRIAVELHYAPRQRRSRDAINLSATLKPVEDGLVDAGVVPGDTGVHVEPTPAVIDEPTGHPGRLYVVVRELPAHHPTGSASR